MPRLAPLAKHSQHTGFLFHFLYPLSYVMIHKALDITEKKDRHLSALLPREPNLYPADDPPRHEHAHHAEEHDERLPQGRGQWVVVRDDDLAVPELVHEVLRLDGDGRAADCVQVGGLGADGRLDDGGRRDVGEVLDVPRRMSVSFDFGRGWQRMGCLTRRPRGGESGRSRLRTPRPRLA